MTDSRTVLLALLPLVAVLVALPVAGAAAVDGGAATVDAGAQANDSNQANNSSSMGAEISAFMQSSASETDGSVADGMFEAQYAANGSDRAALVRNRTDRLQGDLADLRAEKRELRADRGNMSRVEYRARMSRLVGEIRSLERSANRTEPLAASAGVDATALGEIRTNASELSGENVSAIARSLSVVPDHVNRGPPENRTRGPPDDRGGTERNGNAGTANGSAGPPTDRGAGGDRGNDNASTGNGETPGNSDDDGDDADDDGSNGDADDGDADDERAGGNGGASNGGSGNGGNGNSAGPGNGDEKPG